MAGRGRRGPPGRRPRGPPRGYRQQQQDYPEVEELGSKELELGDKSIIIEIKANEQGKFVKILESQTQGRGRIIFSVERAFRFRSILNEFVAEFQRLPPAEEEVTESERIKTDSFSQGRRRYFVDLRQNQRGRFLKVTMLAGGKTFVAIPGEGLVEFRDALAELLDTHGGEDTSGDMDGGGGGDGGERERMRPSGGGGGGGGGPRGPRRGRGGARGGGDGSPPPPPDNLPASKEVRTGMGKTFYFDVEQNDRGTFVRLSEVFTRTGRRTHINVPQSSWSEVGTAFQELVNEMPLPSDQEEGSGGSGSED